MSSNLLICSDVGFENESRIKLGVSSVQGHAANSVLYSGLMGGDSCHLKQNRKQRPDGRYNSIGDGLETSISNEAKGKIERVLGEVRNFSDVEKFVLYLKLPTGDTSSEDLRRTPTPYCKQANRVEQSLAYTWIKSHLEEDIEICLPKQEVYDEYRQYCENHSLVPLCNADFGKLMKTVFPNVKPRRLGQRGQSRYCYGGLRKKLDVEAPSLPEIDVSVSQHKQDEKTEEDHLYRASCDLVLEWAVKLLEQSFNNMRELAEFLVSNLYVNSKSVSAFTVIAAMEEAGAQKVSSMFSNTTGGDRHRETQLQLQRKLHEREHVSRQKKKLQQMKEDNASKQRQERQTPLITSPTGPQELMSPRKIFEESDDAEVRTHSGRSLSQEYGVRPQRQRSTSSARRKKTKSITPQEALEKGGGTSSGEEVSVHQPSKESATKEDQQIYEQSIVGRMSVDMEVQRNSESDYTMEMMSVEDLVLQSKEYNEESWKVEDANRERMDVMEEPPVSVKTESQLSKSLTVSVTEEPAVFQLDSICPKTDSSILEYKAPLSSVSQIPCHLSETLSNQTSVYKAKLESAANPVLINSSQDTPLNVMLNTSSNRILIENLENIESECPSTHSLNSVMSVPINTMAQISSTESTSTQLNFPPKEQAIPTTSVSNRSAFVPFSQFHRKDLVGGDEPDFLSDTDGSLCLPDKAQPILFTKDGKEFFLMTPRPSKLNNQASASLKDSPIQLVPATTTSSNLPSTPVKSSPSVVSIPSEPQSPTTPKKNRSRFTPIRPKGSPAKTVSSILKEQKYPEKQDSEKIDRSKSVSTLLKEKREREAKLQVGVSTPVISQAAVSMSGVGALAAFPASKLQSGETPQVNIIILNPVNPGLGTTPVVSISSDAVTSVTTTLTTVSSHGSLECCSSTVDVSQRRERNRTESFSEYDITSPSFGDNLNISDLSDSSVGDEKPSKLVKIVDSEQNVSSRPGSRCSMDRETPSFYGRKRKLLSSQSIEGSSNIERYPPRVPSNEEDSDYTMEEDKRAASCSLEYKDKCSQRDVSKAFDDKLKLAERRNYPDISDLESDALQDACIPDPSNIIKKGKELCKQKQDTAVGVNSLLRKSQQRLLEEKPKLDERMKTYFQQMETQESQQKTEDSQGSELPPDVAEFITDSMTQSCLSEQMDATVTIEKSRTRSLSRQESVQEICKSLQNIPCNPSPLPLAQSPTILPVSTQRSHSARQLPLALGTGNERMLQEDDYFRKPFRSQSVTDASKALSDTQIPRIEKAPTLQQSASGKESQLTAKKTAGGVEFASPQRPLRRQRTPSTENPKKRESSVERHMIQRELSLERNTAHTPHSDPGYGSVGHSPILQSVLVSSVCDSTYSSMSSTSFSGCRPDSAHSVTSDGIAPSPMASPRFQTSTPYHLKSPSMMPLQASVPGESVLPVQSFMPIPIQGSSLKIDNSSVTLIRPVVTIASQVSQCMTVEQVVTGDLMGEDTTIGQSVKQAPPSYTAAMQDMQRRSKKGKKQGAFQTPLPSLSGPSSMETIGSSKSFYFSDKLAELSRKTFASEKGAATKEKTNKDQNIKSILGHLKSPIDPKFGGQAKGQSLGELPDANYQGNQPNVNMFDIESIVTFKTMDTDRDIMTFKTMETDVDMGTEGESSEVRGIKDQSLDDQVTFSARRNLSEMLGQDFSGDDLQATLEDLKAVDSQYFVENFDIGSEKRQEM